MFQTMTSNMPNLIIASANIACEIIIKLVVIPLERGGIDYTIGGALDVLDTSELWVVSVYLPVLEPSTVLSDWFIGTYLLSCLLLPSPT